MLSESSSPTGPDTYLGKPDRVALAVPVLRGIVAALDQVFESLERDPGDLAPCPPALANVQTQLCACRSATDSAGLTLLGRVVSRALALVERMRAGHIAWSLHGKLALEELTTVVDLVVDVVELVGTDSGCRNEERVSFRILASVAPSVLTEVDGMDLRQIRFHQAVSGRHLRRTA
jgi:hypothetical protein